MRNDSRTANHMLAAIEPPPAAARAGLHKRSRLVSALGLGALVLPAAAVAGAPVRAAPWQAGVSVLIAVLAAAAAARGARARYLPLVGVLMAGVAAWLLAQASYPVAAWLIAPTLGAAVGLACGDRLTRPLEYVAAWPGLLAALGVVAVRSASGRDVAMGAGAALVALSAAGLLLTHGGHATRRRSPLVLAIGGPVLALVTAGYIGATTPSVTWFGSLIHHGPRDSDQVALTFDDGPDPPYTLEISAILDRYGVKGTFFTVGKALEARPDVSRALLDDGQLLANHSYHHDAFRWLDPWYPELDGTQAAFKRTLGVCPALFRPPHGSHTPFMAEAVSDRGMTMVTWDVSAADWATTDAALVAKRVLDRVKPGSIILLHDGIDGNIGADRTVILEALPIILDGLRERGLKPVTMDKLLGVPAYLPGC